MKEEISQFSGTLAEMLAPLVVIGIGLAVNELKKWMASRVKNERARGILERLADASVTVVAEVEQTVRSKTKDLPARERANAAKEAAIASLKSHLGPKGLIELQQVLGLSGLGLESVLSSKIEAQVHQAKQTDALTKIAENTTPVAPTKVSGEIDASKR